MDSPRRLRLGVAFGSVRVPRWQRDLLWDLQISDLCEVQPWVAVAGSGRGRISALFGIYERWDRRRFGSNDDALAPVDLYLPESSGPRQDLDALLWLLDAPLPRERASSLPRGVWYLAQGGARTEAELPLARELRSGCGAVHAQLRVIDGQGDRPLLEAVGPADRMSLHRARVAAYARASRLPLRYLRREALGAAVATKAGVPRAGGPALGPRTVVRLAARVARQRLTALVLREQWFVAYRRRGARRFTTLLPPPGLQYADPFPFSHPNGDALLLECFSQTGDGVIAAARVGGKQRPSVETVLSGESHLSYPFLFAQGSEVLMIPESRRLRRVELWRATEFPGSWTRERVLLEGLPATDATLLARDGRLWLFTAVAADEGPAIDELHIFFTDSLKGEWKTHPLNPVVTNVGCARPAGALFERGGQLIRPAQDCSRAYGWRVVLNRVDVLSEVDYREEPVGVLSPRGLGLTHLHTYNLAGDWEAIDVLRRTPRGFWRRGPSTVRMKPDSPAV